MEEVLGHILNFEIALELLKEQNPNISDEEAEEIYAKCNGNPYNAPLLYQLIKLVKNENDRTI